MAPMRQWIEALRAARTDKARHDAIYRLKEAIEKGEPFDEAIPALLDAMKIGDADTLVAGTSALEAAAARGFDLAPALPGLARALSFTFRHHAARVLIDYGSLDPSRRTRVMEAIQAAGLKGRSKDLDRVMAACTSNIPLKEWRWGTSGVHTKRGCLTWFREVNGMQWSEQTFDDFRKKGPWAPSTVMKEHEIPEEIWAELHQVFGVKPRAQRTKAAIEKEIAETIAGLPAPKKTVEECAVCRCLPDHASANLQTNESLPSGVSRLKICLEFHQGGETYYQCPDCARLYRLDRVVDNEVGASSDDEYLSRTTLDEIAARLRELALVFEWTWSLSGSSRSRGK